MFIPEQEGEHLPENVQEVFPGGFRVGKGETTLDVPESWVFRTPEGLLVLDPGGELPVETPEDRASLKSVAALVTRSTHSAKIQAIRELAERFDTKVSAVLLTHGDADHTNNIENISDDQTPIYIGRKGWWSTLSPEKQFAAGKMNLQKSKFAGADPGRQNGQAGDLHLRDIGFQVAAEALGNPRGGRMRHEKKRQLAARFSDYPESFHLPEATLNVIATPGHAPEEVGFYIPEEKLFIGGDLLTTSKPEQSGRLNLFLPEANIYQALSTLDHLQSLDIERYYPAHGEPIIGADVFRQHLDRLRHDAQTIIDRTLNEHQHDPGALVHELRQRVFTSDIRMPGMAPRSEETWILSILRDRNTDEHVATN